jgi:radical SAM protein with 4Fe4S-binding SPASM domain
MSSDPTYLALNPACSLKLLEKPCIYDKVRDELYEVDGEAAGFLQRLPLPVNESDVLWADAGFLDYCFEEGVLASFSKHSPKNRAQQSPIPSLRYLLLHITTRCNLKCAHCFLGDAEPMDLPLESIIKTMDEFDNMQGLRLLVSGGESFLHPQFEELNAFFDEFSFRTVILSNGIELGDRRLVKRLQAHEVQVSLDGVESSHDALRGPGTYKQAIQGLKNLAESDIDVSIATMIHAANIDDFDELERVVKGFGAKEWNIDVPAPAGRWALDNSLAVAPEVAGPILERSFGGGTHHTSEYDWACGAHLCAVMADGNICKCGFYADSPSGTLGDGLALGWSNIPRIKLDQLRCDCEIIEQCKGGCRYRAEQAEGRFGRDPVMCAANGLPHKTSRRR